MPATSLWSVGVAIVIVAVMFLVVGVFLFFTLSGFPRLFSMLFAWWGLTALVRGVREIRAERRQRQIGR